jgi:hypothetical protein
MVLLGVWGDFEGEEDKRIRIEPLAGLGGDDGNDG